MARIKLGPVVTDISGSIGGLTIQRNRFGITARQKPLPGENLTPAQYNVRQKIIVLQKAWQDLTDAERLQWNRYLDFSGQTINRDNSVLLSGHSLYLKYQLYRLLQGLSLLTTLSYSPMPAYIIPDFLIRAGSELYVHFPGGIAHTTYFFHFKLTNQRNQSQVFNKKGLRFMLTAYSSAGTFYIQVPYIAAFGVLPVLGEWHHYSVVYYSITAPIVTGFLTGKIQSVAP